MEKRPLITVILFLFFLSEIISANSASQIKKIHFPLWAELDAYPELDEAQNLSASTASLTKPANFKIKDNINVIKPAFFNVAISLLSSLHLNIYFIFFMEQMRFNHLKLNRLFSTLS